MAEHLEPYPYGDEFTSVNALIMAAEERIKQGLNPYGHAIIFIPRGDGLSDRIGARVYPNGDVQVGAHCENI